MCNSLIFKPMGGGVKLTPQSAIFRAKKYISQKCERNRHKITAEERSLLLHVLRSRFGVEPKQMVEEFPWSRTIVYDSLVVGQWLEENHNTQAVKKRIDEIINYIVYLNRYNL